MFAVLAAAVASSADEVALVHFASCPQHTHFLCQDNSACVPLTWLCDLANDCGDRSDEGPSAGCSGMLGIF